MFELTTELAAATAGKPAGGAAVDQVAIATGGATIVTALLLWLCSGHRSGKVSFLGRASAFTERMTGIPSFAALPLAVGATALQVALLGMYWDIALHIDLGRDEGPLANPAHYLILVGLYGVFAAGVLAISLPRPGERPGPAAIRITDRWHAPVGGILIAACGAFALIGFPLDDMWHRLFGQDVTLWGPTHLMLIGGAGMTLVGFAVLLTEAVADRRARGVHASKRKVEKRFSLLVTLRRAGTVGGFLIGLSTFQAEFDFGVPQYAAVFQPFLIALAAGGALAAARIWIGPGGAVMAVVFYFVVRGAAGLLTAAFGATLPAMPLYLGEALVVELVALALLRRSPLGFAAAAGVGIGTLGFAAEYAWSQLVMRLPWTEALLPEGVVYAVAGGVAGSIAGVLLALGLRGRLPRPAIARGAIVGAGLLLAAATAVALQTTVPQDTRASVQLTDVRGGVQDREAQATVRITPASAAEDVKWLTITGWQGDGLHVDRLERVGEGVFRTTEPMPLHGNWKTLVRLHAGDDLAAVPVFLPSDPAIPAPEIPATASFERPFVAEIDLLQRERKDDVAGWIWAAASAVVLALYLVFLGALSWGVGRLSRRLDRDAPPPPHVAEPPRFGRGPVSAPVPAG